MNRFSLRRRSLLQGTSAALAWAATAAWAQGAAHAVPHELRIGHQKGLLSLLKSRGTLEQRLRPLGVSIKWIEFAAGPVQLEALNVGAIDFGDVGEAPPIFAQAAGAPLAYVAASVPRPASEAVLVHKDSAVQRVADLRGRKVGLNKGSNVHYFLVKLLEQHGLAYGDVTPVFLSPSDARAAFEKGAIDAWVIWDPFLALAEKSLGARVLADATGVVSNRYYYFSSQNYARDHADVIRILIEELNTAEQWGQVNRDALATELGRIWGLPQPVAALSVGRMQLGIGPMTPAILAEQQKIADTFYALKLIPKPIQLSDAVVKKT